MRKIREVSENTTRKGHEWGQNVHQSVIAKVEQLGKEYSLTGNPLALWQAYRLARQSGSDGIPTWILEALDTTAERLIELTYTDNASHWTHGLAEAFGFRFSRNGGASDPFAARRRQSDQVDMAVRVRILVDADGHNETDATYLVASRLGVSEATVSRAWKQFSAVARLGELDTQRYAIAFLDEQCRIIFELENQ